MKTKKPSLLTRSESSGHLNISRLFLGVWKAALSRTPASGWSQVLLAHPTLLRDFPADKLSLTHSAALGTRFLLRPRDEVVINFPVSETEFVWGMGELG